jgi:hypothetical protein
MRLIDMADIKKLANIDVNSTLTLTQRNVNEMYRRISYTGDINKDFKLLNSVGYNDCVKCGVTLLRHGHDRCPPCEDKDRILEDFKYR